MKKALRELKERENKEVKYPPELKTATRAEYTTRVRMAKKKKGGYPLALLSLVVILWSIYIVIEHIDLNVIGVR